MKYERSLSAQDCSWWTLIRSPGCVSPELSQITRSYEPMRNTADCYQSVTVTVLPSAWHPRELYFPCDISQISLSYEPMSKYSRLLSVCHSDYVTLRLTPSGNIRPLGNCMSHSKGNTTDPLISLWHQICYPPDTLGLYTSPKYCFSREIKKLNFYTDVN